MRNSAPKPFKNVLLTEYFNVYDTVRLPSHHTSRDPPPPLLQRHKKSNSTFISTLLKKKTGSENFLKDSTFSAQMTNMINKNSTRSLFQTTDSELERTDQKDPELKQKTDYLQKVRDSKHFSNSSDARGCSGKFDSKCDKDEQNTPCSVPRIETVTFFRPKLEKISSSSQSIKQKKKKCQPLSFLEPKPLLTNERQQETKDFLNYLDFLHSNQPSKVQKNPANNVHLKMRSKNTHKVSCEYNIYSPMINRQSVVKGLNERLYYGKRATLKESSIPFLEDLIPSSPTLTNFQRNRTIKKSTINLEPPKNLLLKSSNFHEHQLLLEDLLKAVLSLKRQKNEKTCIRMLQQLLGNCKRLLEALINFEKEPLQLQEPLTPRSFFLRLADQNSSKSISRLTSMRSFNSDTANFKVPWLDEGFIRQLIDFKLRLQEAGITYQNDRYREMRDNIVKEYESILEKELGRLQKGKLEGNRRKYEKVKKEMYARMDMGDFFTGSTVNIGLRNCENNCGELVLVDKIEKAALVDLESAIFTIKCRQSDILKSIE